MGVYLRAKFEISSMVLTSSRQGEGCNFTPPSPPQNEPLKSPLRLGLLGIIQTVIKEMLQVTFFFFQNSYNLTILLKQTVFYQLFRINRTSGFYQLQPPAVLFFLLSQIFVLPIFTQTASCLCPEINKWHLSWFNFIKLFSNHSTASVVHVLVY